MYKIFQVKLLNEQLSLTPFCRGFYRKEVIKIYNKISIFSLKHRTEEIFIDLILYGTHY